MATTYRIKGYLEYETEQDYEHAIEFLDDAGYLDEPSIETHDDMLIVNIFTDYYRNLGRYTDQLLDVAEFGVLRGVDVDMQTEGFVHSTDESLTDGFERIDLEQWAVGYGFDSVSEDDFDHTGEGRVQEEFLLSEW